MSQCAGTGSLVADWVKHARVHSTTIVQLVG